MELKKTYYSIKDVCHLTGLEPHVLRYWESEFPQLHPKKNRAGFRAYRTKDIDLILAIKNLLYVEQYTIQGAKKKLTEMRENKTDIKEIISPPPASASPPEGLASIKQELSSILQILKG